MGWDRMSSVEDEEEAGVEEAQGPGVAEASDEAPTA